MINQTKVYNLIGLCKKANLLVSGITLCENAIRSKKAVLVIIAQDAGANTRKDIKNICNYYNIDLVKFGTGDMLGKLTRSNKKTVIAIKDEGFKIEILKKIESSLGEA